MTNKIRERYRGASRAKTSGIAHSGGPGIMPKPGGHPMADNPSIMRVPSQPKRRKR
jgi:hypothetical protein